MTLRSLTACLLLTLCLPALAVAQELPLGKWWTIEKIAEPMNLTKEMKDKLDGLYLETRSRLIDLKSSVEREQLNLDRLMMKDPLSETEVMAQFKKLDAARSALNAERFHHVVQERAIIGIDRFQRLEKLFREMRPKRAPGGPGGPGMPGGPGEPGGPDGPDGLDGHGPAGGPQP